MQKSAQIETLKQQKIVILDANAFISQNKLLNLGTDYRMVTTHAVLNELKDQKTRQLVKNLPFEIELMDESQKSLKFVSKFAEKTGDYASLSEIDLQLIALAHTLYIKYNLENQLRYQPIKIKSTKILQSSQNTKLQQHINQNKQTNQQQQQQWQQVQYHHQQQSNEDQNEQNDDEEDQWITPTNYNSKIKNMIHIFNQAAKQQQQLTDSSLLISVVTADYAIQNVLTHMNINILSIDNRRIKQLHRYIWQCYLCLKLYQTLQNPIKRCDNCGYITLSKISYSLNQNGEVQLHRKKGWKPNKQVQSWKQKQYEMQEKYRNRKCCKPKKKALSIFDNQ